MGGRGGHISIFLIELCALYIEVSTRLIFQKFTIKEKLGKLGNLLGKLRNIFGKLEMCCWLSG